MKCITCSNEFEGRADARFCSASCRVKFSRDKGIARAEDGLRRQNVIISKPSYVTLTPEQVLEADERFGMAGSIISAYESYLKFKEANPEDTFMPNWLREYLHPTERYA